MTSPWAIYDALIAGIPDGPVAVEAQACLWAAVRTESGAVGVALPFKGGPRIPAEEREVRGRPLREVASWVKSWNLERAAIGAAALNAWYADPARLGASEGVTWDQASTVFERDAARIADSRTVVVGHFTEAEKLGDSVTVLERNPQKYDLPDAAAEFVIPHAELVYITGSALVNKTLPRLLDLARHAEVHVVGPTSVPVRNIYPACVAAVHSVVVTDPDRVWATIQAGRHFLSDRGGYRMVELNVRQLSNA